MAPRELHTSSNGDGRSSRSSLRRLEGDDSSGRRDSRRLTSDVYLDLVMPQITALRQQNVSKDASIGNLEQTLAKLEDKNGSLSKDLRQKSNEIAHLNERLQIAEEATLGALKEICKERDIAEKEASEFRSRFMVSQLKLKREIAKYHKLHMNMDLGRQQWAEEKKQLQQIQKDAGVKLLSLLEDFLDAQQKFDKLESKNKRQIDDIPPPQPMEDDKKPESVKSVVTAQRDTARSEDESSSTKRKERDRANSSKKRLSVNTQSDFGSDTALYISKVPLPAEASATTGNINEKKIPSRDASASSKSRKSDRSKPRQKASKTNLQQEEKGSTKGAPSNKRSAEELAQIKGAAGSRQTTPATSNAPAQTRTEQRVLEASKSFPSLPISQAAAANSQQTSAETATKLRDTGIDPPKTPKEQHRPRTVSKANTLPPGMSIPPRYSSRQTVSSQGSPMARGAARSVPSLFGAASIPGTIAERTNIQKTNDKLQASSAVQKRRITLRRRTRILNRIKSVFRRRS